MVSCTLIETYQIEHMSRNSLSPLIVLHDWLVLWGGTGNMLLQDLGFNESPRVRIEWESVIRWSAADGGVLWLWSLQKICQGPIIGVKITSELPSSASHKFPWRIVARSRMVVQPTNSTRQSALSGQQKHGFQSFEKHHPLALLIIACTRIWILAGL